MAENAPDLGRRRFLTATCAVVGGVGGVFAAVPFFSSFLPSAKAVSAGVPTTVDISKLSEGAQLIEVWRKRPVWIIKRSEESLAALDSIKVRLKDAESSEEDQQPKYAKNIWNGWLGSEIGCRRTTSPCSMNSRRRASGTCPAA